MFSEKSKNTIFVTGGAGFIGSALIRYLIKETHHEVINIDKLTYAGNLNSLLPVQDSNRYHFIKADICDNKKINSLLSEYQPNLIMHLAAESHVDRSIVSPDEFINTNIVGTYNLLFETKKYWSNLKGNAKQNFRFHHVSTDEVYGDLPHPEKSNIKPLPLFTESTPYNPSSPYSASKAASDHLVRAWHRTYGLPIVLTNCSNNYGSFHHPEKLIPLMILNAIANKKLPIYGKGNQIRDWLFVEDHVKALILVATKGRVGETYNIGGHNEMTNIDVVQTICRILDELKPKSTSYSNQITFVKDRPGHDMRYAIDASKIENELGWVPKYSFESGIRKTVKWYLDNLKWCYEVQDTNAQNKVRFGK